MLGNARCKKDNTCIIMNAFGAMLNDDLKTLLTFVSIVQGLAKFGANAAAKKNIPINLFMAGDILFYSMVIGKEGMPGWWCSYYCKLFKNNWQRVGHEQGESCSVEMLAEHAWRIKNKEINKKDKQIVCGVRGEPGFNAIQLQHYLAPILHLTIGKGNNALNNYVAKLQAMAEGYTDEYYALEKAKAQAAAAQLDAKDKLPRFNMVTLEYEKELKRQQKRRALSDEDRLIVRYFGGANSPPRCCTSDQHRTA
jgi:hypothetical protein